MNNARKALLGLILLIAIVSNFAHAVSAQENVTKEDILSEAQRNFDRSLSILNIVASSMGALVGLITIIIVIAIAVGIFEYSKWKSMRNQIEEKVKNIEKDVNFIRELRNKAEKDAGALRNELEKIPHAPLTEKPSKETVEKLDEFSRRLELLEVLGVSLKPEDYIGRGNDLYYKGKYELALKAYEKSIELKPDFAEAWNNRGVALGKLNRLEEALKAFEKAIELKPDFAEAWNNRGVALGKLNRPEEELKAHEKAIELKPDYANAWFNRACTYSIKRDKEKSLSDLKKAIELDRSYKEAAKKDRDFEWLWDDEDFKKLVR